MKTKQSENNFKGALGKIFERRRRRRDPLLALNISAFFNDGWRRTFRDMKARGSLPNKSGL
jgi:hypothetical protein